MSAYDDGLEIDPAASALSLLLHSARVSPVLKDAVLTVIASFERRVPLPYRHCIVHEQPARGDRCMHAVVLASGTSRMERSEPAPCQFVTPYYDPTEET